MKRVLLIGVLAFLSMTAAEARPGGHRGGFHHSHARVAVGVSFVAAPFYFYRPAPVYYAPPPVYVAPAPVTYIEQPQVPQASGDWYYCPQYRAYYPQVSSCPGPWQRVPPQPQVQAPPPPY